MARYYDVSNIYLETLNEPGVKTVVLCGRSGDVVPASVCIRRNRLSGSTGSSLCRGCIMNIALDRRCAEHPG
jgi:hypothetical protein